jgi:arylsulfatase A-like enzyme
MRFAGRATHLFVCAAIALSASRAFAADAKKPNIVFILSDDLGYGDLGCYGQKMIHTPNLDRMASEGVRFTQCYSGSAVCAPSRATLMTGLHTGHAPIRNNGNSVLTPEWKSVATVLNSAGYHTALIGKWGLSTKEGVGAPEQNGFDESLAYLTHTQAHDYTPDTLWQNGHKIDVTSGTYAPDLFTSAALDFISKAGDKPFFLYFTPTFPHANNELQKLTGNGMEIPSDAPYSDKDWPQPEKNKAAMITYLDNEVGQLLSAIKQKGLEENTIVFFTSDNGPHHEGGVKAEFFNSGGGLKGVKRDLYEGGVREPMIVRWPGKLKPRTSDKAWAFWDFLPTAAELAGATAPASLDGVSVVSTLLKDETPRREYLYWELIDKSGLSSYKGFQQAARIGNWKAIKRDKGVELYDMTSDAAEQHDVAAQHADIVARAENIFTNGRTELPDKQTTGTKKNNKQTSGSSAGSEE